MIRASYFAESAIWFLLLTAGSWADDPQPPPIPPPVPPAPVPVAPDLPVAAIDVTDVSGRPLESVDDVLSARKSQLLIVSGAKAVHGEKPESILWDVESNPPDSAQWFAWPGTGSVAISTGTQDATVTVSQWVSLGDRGALLKISIKIGNGPQPPPGPGPGPDPGPKPQPNPSPQADHLGLWVIGPAGPVSLQQSLVLNAHGVWNELAGAATGNRVQQWSADTKEAVGQSKVAEVTAAKVPLPAMIVEDLDAKKTLAVIPLPNTVDDLRAVIKSYVRGSK